MPIDYILHRRLIEIQKDVRLPWTASDDMKVLQGDSWDQIVYN